MLEDSDLDAELIGIELARLPRRVELLRANDRTSFLAHLPKADLILADYSLPGMDGMMALELAKKFKPGTPFVFISGVIGEEFATEALRQGATDYVVKHRMNRLSGAIDRTLKETEERSRARLAESQLDESQQRVQATFTNVQVGILEMEPKSGLILRANPALHRMLGYPDDALIGQPAAAILPDEVGKNGGGSLVPAGRTRVTRQERRLIGRDGVGLWADMSAVFVPGGGDAGGYVLISILDTTHRRHAEETLRDREAKLRLAADAARLGSWDFDPRTNLLVLDGRCRLLCGFTFEEPVEYQTFLRRCHVDDRSRLRNAIAEAMEPGGSGRLAQEFRTITPERRVYWLSILGQAVFEDGICVGFAGFLQDITRQKRTEEALQRSNQMLEARVVERTRERDQVWLLSRDLMMVADADLVPVAVNPAWSEILDWTESELFRLSLFDLTHPEDVAILRAETARVLKQLPSHAAEVRLRHRDGSYRVISWTSVAAGKTFHAVGRDVTEERLAQDKLRQAQKIETIGQLTGGVAHDFNNLLTVIVGNLESMQRHVAKVPEGVPRQRIERATEYAMQGAQKASVLTQRLLAFSRRQPLRPRPLSVNRLIAGMSDLLNRTLGAHIAIKVIAAPDIWFAMVDPNQMENSILNLGVNARDAMAEGGILTIETANVTLDARQALAEPDMPPGQYVMVAIRDNGCGMTPDTLSRAFEPFFTTKDVGHGTGLGLSQVYGFVKQSGGHVRITSQVGRGTSVRIYLPRELTIAEDAEPAPAVATPAALGHETILLVEDNEEVRAYSTSVLQELGYRVVQAENGPSALQALRHHAEVKLLFTDVGLPGGMNGRQLAEAAQKERPDLKVLFTSGYESAQVLAQYRREDGPELVSKPFTYQYLAEKVRAALDGKG